MLLIKNATIVDPESKLNGKKRDILIKNGKIEDIKAKITIPNIKTINESGLCVSIGWLDVGTQVGDPGFEHREDLDSAAKAAAAGGFTAIACLPNTHPVIHSKSEVLYIKNNTQNSIVDFYPIGAISQDCKGEAITEMMDMNRSGAVAFSDGKKSLQSNGLMMRALNYVKAFDGIIMNEANDESISGNAQMHEGVTSTSLGMKGFPVLAEEIMVQRDIYLAEYTNSKVHISNISSGGSVDLVRKAKANGIQVSCSVAAMSLAFDESVLTSFDSNYKVFPPLREKGDIGALKKGLKDGTIDYINSNHTPLDKEAKDLEFPYADFGVIGLETSFAVSNTFLKKTLSTEQLIEKLAVRPRQILQLPIPQIAVGASANLTLFQTNKEWTVDKKDIYSKSKNTPFIGMTLKGKVLGIINNKKVQLFN